MNRKNKIFLHEDKHYPNDEKTEARENALETFNPASSVTDCTGLIPFGIQDDCQLEAYHEIISFTPPENKDKQRK